MRQSVFFALGFLCCILLLIQPARADQTLTLQSGFNFAAVTSTTSATADSLLSGNSFLQQLFVFNADTQTFKFRLKLDASNLFGDTFSFTPGQGLVLKASASGSVSIIGPADSSTSQATLKPGFNFLGYAPVTTDPLASALLSGNSTVKSIFRWDAALQSFRFLLRLENGNLFGDDFTLQPETGYFINLGGSNQLTINVTGTIDTSTPFHIVSVESTDITGNNSQTSPLPMGNPQAPHFITHTDRALPLVDATLSYGLYWQPLNGQVTMIAGNNDATLWRIDGNNQLTSNGSLALRQTGLGVIFFGPVPLGDGSLKSNSVWVDFSIAAIPPVVVNQIGIGTDLVTLPIQGDLSLLLNSSDPQPLVITGSGFLAASATPAREYRLVLLRDNGSVYTLNKNKLDGSFQSSWTDTRIEVSRTELLDPAKGNIQAGYDGNLYIAEYTEQQTLETRSNQSWVRFTSVLISGTQPSPIRKGQTLTVQGSAFGAGGQSSATRALYYVELTNDEPSLIQPLANNTTSASWTWSDTAITVTFPASLAAGSSGQGILVIVDVTGLDWLNPVGAGDPPLLSNQPSVTVQ